MTISMNDVKVFIARLPRAGCRRNRRTSRNEPGRTRKLRCRSPCRAIAAGYNERMKRKERHHLKENELQRIALQARDVFKARRREMSNLLIGGLVVVVAGAGYFLWREHVQARAHALLADALAVQSARVAAAGTPATVGTYPTDRARLEAAAAKFKAAADAYPSTDAGIFARYQEAANQFALGNMSIAVAGYQEVLRR